MSQDYIDSIAWGGLPSPKARRAAAEEKLKREPARVTREVRDSVVALGRDLGRIDGRLQKVEALLYRSVLLQEKMLLAQMALIPEEDRPVQLPDAEIQARQIMGFSVFDKLTGALIKKRFKALAKKKHPDVAGVESEADFILLENAYQLLLSSVSS